MVFLYNKLLKSRARTLRKKQTDTETFLWSKLRSRQIAGHKFRRQFPIAQFIVDFYCLEKKVAIELDGSQHSSEDQFQYDKNRTTKLEKFGIKVLRFWDNEIFNNTNGVLEKILSSLQK